MNKTKIQWTDYSWPIVNGCTRVSPGCQACYAERLAATRLSKTAKYGGLATMHASGPRWTGEVRPWPAALEEPLRLRKTARIFVADMGDLFHEGVPDAFIDRVFAVMLATNVRGHLFQVLTKRPERMRRYASDPMTPVRVACQLATLGTVSGRVVPRPTHVPAHLVPRWPLRNVWLGVSCEDQKRADERIPLLLETPAGPEDLRVREFAHG